jgi:hypothetical protein
MDFVNATLSCKPTARRCINHWSKIMHSFRVIRSAFWTVDLPYRPFSDVVQDFYDEGGLALAFKFLKFKRSARHKRGSGGGTHRSIQHANIRQTEEKRITKLLRVVPNSASDRVVPDTVGTVETRTQMRPVSLASSLVIFSSSIALDVLFFFHPVKADDGFYRNQFYVCSNSQVIVEDISILCDSPGAYYYGSGKYRNSAQCQAGDKAKLQIGFTIGQYFPYQDAYLTVMVQAYGSVATEYVFSGESFCSTVKVTSSSTACPGAGTYQLSQNFYWESMDDEYFEYNFTPKVIVGVSTRANSNQFDLGGANTKQCNGGSISSNWTSGVRKSVANTFRNFVKTFGILTFGLSAVAFAAWFLVRQARKVQPKIIIVDEEIDDQSTAYYIQNEQYNDDNGDVKNYTNNTPDADLGKV